MKKFRKVTEDKVRRWDRLYLPVTGGADDHSTIWDTFVEIPRPPGKIVRQQPAAKTTAEKGEVNE